MESVNLKLKTQNEKGISVMGYAFFHFAKVFCKNSIMHGYNMAKCYGRVEEYVDLHRSGMHKGLQLCFAVCGYLDCR